MPVAKKDVPEEKDKPVFDEQTLAKLLEAAFVMQEHNRGRQRAELNPEVQKEKPGEKKPPASVLQHDSALIPHGAEPSPTEPSPKDDYNSVLTQVIETQRQIQTRHLDLESAMSLVAQRVVEIAKADGTGIGILTGKSVRYRAAAGLLTLPCGSEVATEKALCSACLRTGEVVRCADVNADFLLDADECHRRGIRSLIAVPVYHEGGIAGAVELYYANTQAFTEQDVHTCQLMAGLVTEAMARDEELTSRKSLASERAAMLDALEKLKPNLAGLMNVPAVPGAKASAPAPSASIFICRKCGHPLVGEEQFCGNCGQPRSSDYEPPSMQSKVATLWRMQEALKQGGVEPSSNTTSPKSEPQEISTRPRAEKPLAESIEEEMPEFFGVPEARINSPAGPVELPHPVSSEIISEAVKEDAAPQFTISSGSHEEEAETSDEEETETSSEQAVLTKPESTAAWSSAASAREFLERLAPDRRNALTALVRTRRGDLYLAVAVVFVVCVLGWGVWSNHSVGATGSPATAGHRKPSPDADLSWFDRMLVQLGLAEAPEPAEARGNPEIQVWVDLQTALYYCPGADLYGKTAKGKFATQRDAQLDQFEPAYRKACN
jgi:putative methionine-R-sulfoxide reductase with GAF domain